MVPPVELEQHHVVWKCGNLTQQHQPGQRKNCHPEQIPHYLTLSPAAGDHEIEIPQKQVKGVDHPHHQVGQSHQFVAELEMGQDVERAGHPDTSCQSPNLGH